MQFLGAVTKQTPFMIVTEFMVGGSLADLFKGQRFPQMWRSLQLALDMARGLAYLHNRSPQVGTGPLNCWLPPYNTTQCTTAACRC